VGLKSECWHSSNIKQRTLSNYLVEVTVINVIASNDNTSQSANHIHKERTITEALMKVENVEIVLNSLNVKTHF